MTAEALNPQTASAAELPAGYVKDRNGNLVPKDRVKQIDRADCLDYAHAISGSGRLALDRPVQWLTRQS